jgi:hypothetical protein
VTTPATATTTTTTTTATPATAASPTPATDTSPTPAVAPGIVESSDKPKVTITKKVTKAIRTAHPGTTVAVKKLKHKDLKKKAKLRPELPLIF